MKAQRPLWLSFFALFVVTAFWGAYYFFQLDNKAIFLFTVVIYIISFGSLALLIKYYIKKHREQQLLAEVELNKQKYFATQKYDRAIFSSKNCKFIGGRFGFQIGSGQRNYLFCNSTN